MCNSQAWSVNLTMSRAAVAPAMAITSQTTLMYDAGRGAWAETGQRGVTITSQKAPGKHKTIWKDSVMFILIGSSSWVSSRWSCQGCPAFLWRGQGCLQLPVSLRPSILCRRPDCEWPKTRGHYQPATSIFLPRPESNVSFTILATFLKVENRKEWLYNGVTGFLLLRAVNIWESFTTFSTYNWARSGEEPWKNSRKKSEKKPRTKVEVK